MSNKEVTVCDQCEHMIDKGDSESIKMLKGAKFIVKDDSCEFATDLDFCCKECFTEHLEESLEGWNWNPIDE